jgi:hypothetical protein
MLNEAETRAKLIDPAWWPISWDSTKAKSGFDPLSPGNVVK